VSAQFRGECAGLSADDSPSGRQRQIAVYRVACATRRVGGLVLGFAPARQSTYRHTSRSCRKSNPSAAIPAIDRGRTSILANVITQGQYHQRTGATVADPVALPVQSGRSKM